MKQIIFLMALCSGVFWSHNTFALKPSLMIVTTNGVGQAVTNHIFITDSVMSAAQTAQLESKKHPTLAIRWLELKVELKDDLNWLIKEDPVMGALLAVGVLYGVIFGWWAIQIKRSWQSDIRRAQLEKLPG